VDSEPAALTARRAVVAPVPWTWLRQVHGSRVVVVTEPGEHAGEEADAAVTIAPGAVVAVQTADCAPVVLTAGTAVGVAHVGWRGLLSGVLENTVAVVREHGSLAVTAQVGPSIGPECYEFGESDLGAVVARYGEGARSRTAHGSVALDLWAAIRVALAELDIVLPPDRPPCTGCDGQHYFSHRARRERERMATIVYRVQ